ncbi:30S ribosomal protein S3 [Candidatus Woesearchaeota archaeon]|nr:30S ribosomal protein S3 [Candidatus Woesearchaeota archaeon]
MIFLIEREFVKQKKKEFQVEEFVSSNLKNVEHSGTKMQRTPLGEKIIISSSRPGLVVGREGKNIKKLTSQLKNRFKLENPQIEINEVENVNANSKIVAEKIAGSLERFGLNRFKGVGHKSLSEAMGAGALGIEILISGKVPSSRAKTWRFYAGYLKKCGDIAITGVDKAYATAHLKSGAVGIQVRIMPPGTKLPDDIQLVEEKEEKVEEVKEEKSEEREDSEKKESEEKTDKKKSEESKEKSEPEEEEAAEEEEIKESSEDKETEEKTEK